MIARLKTLWLTVLLAAVTGAAHAQERVLSFQQLEAAAYEDWLVLTYSIPQGVWQSLDGRVPVLQVTQTEQGEVYLSTTHRVPLSAPAAQVQLPRARATRVGRVTVSIDPASTLPPIDGMSVAGLVGPALELSITPVRLSTPVPLALPPPVAMPEPAPPAPIVFRPDLSQVLGACGVHVTGSNSITDCADRAMVALFDPVPSIEACGAAVTGSTNVLACIDAAVQAPGEPSAVVAACAEAVVGSTSVVDCLGRAARHLVVPTEAVIACGESVTGSTHVLDCIDASRDAGASAASVIRACADTQTGSSAGLDCVRRTASGR